MTDESKIYHRDEFDLEQKVIHYQSELEKYKAKLKSLRRRKPFKVIDALEKENEQLKEEAAHYKAQFLDLQKEGTLEIERKNNTINNLQEANRNLTNKISGITTEIHQLSQKLSIKNEGATLEEKLNDIYQHYKDITNKNNSLITEKESLEKKLQNFIAENKQKEQEMQELHKKFQHAKREWEHSKKNLHEKIQKMEEEKKKNQEKIADLTHFKEEMHTKLNRLKKEIGDNEFIHSLANFLPFQQDLYQQTKKLLDQVNIYGKKIKNSESIIHELEKEIAQQVNDIERIKDHFSL